MLMMANAIYFNLKAKVQKFFQKENGDVNVVAIVVLIGVAVVLALIFKDEISKLLRSLIKTISGKAQEAVSCRSKPQKRGNGSYCHCPQAAMKSSVVDYSFL